MDKNGDTDSNAFLRYMHGSRDESGEKQVANPITEAFKQTGFAKVTGTMEFLKVLIENKCKFILFAHHGITLNAYEEHFKKMKLTYMRIDGSTSTVKRHQNVKNFQEDPLCQIALLSILAAYQGITLTAASKIVFAEFYWTPGIMQ